MTRIREEEVHNHLNWIDAIRLEYFQDVLVHGLPYFHLATSEM